MAIAREKILARRKRLDSKQAKLKALQEMLREEEKRMANLIQKSEAQKLKIIGQIMLERMESDQELKTWFGQEIEKRLTKKQERNLFSLE
ncbi:MAG: hypothetical protein U1F66_11165 [bacterium]